MRDVKEQLGYVEGEIQALTNDIKEIYNVIYKTLILFNQAIIGLCRIIILMIYSIIRLLLFRTTFFLDSKPNLHPMFV